MVSSCVGAGISGKQYYPDVHYVGVCRTGLEKVTQCVKEGIGVVIVEGGHGT